MRHKGCGGTIREDYDRGKYPYCSDHDNECDVKSCPRAVVFPALVCDTCDEEILGDAMIEMEDLWLTIPFPPRKKPMHEERLLQFFKYDHLPVYLADVSRPFCELAEQIVCRLPRNPERTVALRKLLEAKDCAVRCVLEGSE